MLQATTGHTSVRCARRARYTGVCLSWWDYPSKTRRHSTSKTSQNSCGSVNSCCPRRSSFRLHSRSRPTCAARYADLSVCLSVCLQFLFVLRTQFGSFASQICLVLLTDQITKPPRSLWQAVMEMFARVRTLGVRHALYGTQEATWQFSCDFAM